MCSMAEKYCQQRQWQWQKTKQKSPSVAQQTSKEKIVINLDADMVKERKITIDHSVRIFVKEKIINNQPV